MRCLLLVLMFALALPAAATDYVLRDDGLGAFPTIQDAVIASADGDTISLWNGTYSGEGNVNVDLMGKALLVRSLSGDPTSCMIDVIYQGRAFLFQSGEDSTTVLSGLGITRGYVISNGYGGAALIEGASPKFQNCHFTNNVAGLDGGAVYASSGFPVFSGCRFEDNSAFQEAGAVEVHGGAEFRECVFERNESLNNAFGALHSRSGESLLLVDCEFRENTAVEEGGALGITSTGNVTIRSCVFESNTAGLEGGAIEVPANVEVLYIEDCLFRANSSSNGGGAIFSEADAVIAGCQFVENETTGSSGHGGALCFEDFCEVHDCTFFDNTADGWGAAAYIHGSDGNSTLTGCTFVRNSSTHGGAVYLPSSDAMISNSTFYGNTNEQGSGGISLSGGAVTVGFSLFVANGTSWNASPVVEGSPTPGLYCTDIWGNPGGDWIGNLEFQQDIAGNISLDPYFCDVEDDDFTLHEDSPCAAFSDPNPECDQIGAWPVGCGLMGAPPASDMVGSRLSLGSANPTEGDRIAFQTSIEKDGLTGQLAIFDATGRLIEELHSGQLAPGTRMHTWDRLDSEGRRAPAGVYFVRLSDGRETATRCFVLLQ